MKDEIKQAVILLSQRLLKDNATVTTIESCTGGGVASALTALAGSSKWFEYGFVTYSNAAKTALVNVDVELLSRYGAVSSQVAEAMAKGGVKAAQADYALSITGIAGPDGGTDQKPVGSVFLGWSDKFGRVKVAAKRFDGNREEIRNQAIISAITGMTAFIAEHES